MANEQKRTGSKRKENIRVFVRRKHLSSSYLSKSATTQSNSLEQLTSIIEKNCNKTKKNIIVVNYRPVFTNSSNEKRTNEVNSTSASSIDARCSSSTTPNSIHSKTSPIFQRKSTSFDVPDVDDPLTFIELMYQQMFTEDGQLKAGSEPTAFANCVKQIVTQSRRNSFARRDSTMTNNPLHFSKNSPMSFHHPMSSKRTSRCPSPRFAHQPLSEEEDSNAVTTHRTRTADRSRR